MNTNHTPGPWHRNIRANGHYPTIYAGRNQHVAIACAQNTGEETEANIDLIAAAPDLLDALTCAEGWIEQYTHFPQHNPAAIQMLKVVRAAIAKATVAK